MLVRNLGIAACCVAAMVAAASAQEATIVQRPYDGIQAGLDAYRLAEEKRQGALAQQLFLNDQMRFWNGYPTSRGAMLYPGYGSVFGGLATPLLGSANLDYVYGSGSAYASGSAYGSGAGPLLGAAGLSWPLPLAVFQPWPYVPGNIYGYPAYYQPARQPVGQQQMQTGPNRWESHPVYDPPLSDYRPPPPVASPLLDGTPYGSVPATAPVTVAPPPGPAPAAAPGAAESLPPPAPQSIPRRPGPREY